MILIVCARDIDSTLVKGDFISCHDDDSFLGHKMGVLNAVDPADYINNSPFLIVRLPSVTAEEVESIFKELLLEEIDGETFAKGRKYKIDIDILESRASNSYYSNDDNTPTKERFKPLGEPVRRDTLNAYREIIKPNLSLSEIMVIR